MTQRIIPAISLVAIPLCIALGGCDSSYTPPVASEGTQKVCDAIKITAPTKQCVASEWNRSIAIVIDTTDEVARNLCEEIGRKIKPLTGDLSGQWKFQIFSPYREDKPLAACNIE